MRKSVPWRDSFSSNLETVYRIAYHLRLKLPYQNFSIWVSIWGQCRRIEKRSMIPMVITKVRLLRSLTQIVLIRKNTSELLDIWTMINNPSNSVRLKIWEYLGFLSGKYCMKIFVISHTRWEWGNFFYYRPWRTKEKTMLQTQASPLTEHALIFCPMRKFSARIRWWTICSITTKYSDSDEN